MEREAGVTENSPATRARRGRARGRHGVSACLAPLLVADNEEDGHGKTKIPVLRRMNDTPRLTLLCRFVFPISAGGVHDDVPG